jgi:NAD(P)-dependent dehydrogenase (short-subunit alcohol dehydrogenase family)
MKPATVRARQCRSPWPDSNRHLDRFTGGNVDAKNGFLASDKARFLTGQSVTVDGGYTAQ